MEFRKMVTMTLYARQQKRHRCTEQSFGLWEKAKLRWFERIALKHVYYHMWTDRQSRFHTWGRVLPGRCTGMTLRGGRGVHEGEHMYTHGWLMSMYGKNHYNIVEDLERKNCLQLKQINFLKEIKFVDYTWLFNWVIILFFLCNADETIRKVFFN